MSIGLFLRDWKKLVRRRGAAPYGVLLVVLLLAAQLVVDQVERFDAAQARLEQRAAAIAEARSWQRRLPQLEKDLAAAETSYGGLTPRLLRPEAGAEAALGEQFARALGKWYEKFAGAAAVLSVTPVADAGPGKLRAEVAAGMNVGQLTALLEGRAAAPLVLRLVEATIEPNDLNQPSSLRTRLTWETVAGLPVPAAATEPKAGGKAARKETPERSVTRGEPRPVAPDAKRK